MPGWLKRLYEKLTHYEELRTQILELQERLEQQERENKELSAHLRAKEEAPLSLENAIYDRFSVLEHDRNELFVRLDTLQKQLDGFLQQAKDDTRIAILEQDRTELFARLDVLEKQVNEFLQQTKDDTRVAILEQDRSELFARIDEIESDQNNGFENRIQILETDRTALYKRLDDLKYILCNTGIINLKSRLDSRIIRLEILWYYRDKNRRQALNEDELALLDKLETEYDYGRDTGRTYPEDKYYQQTESKLSTPYQMGKEDGIWYAEIDGKKIYLGENKKDAELYIQETLFYLEGNTPHRYLNPEEDGIDIPEGSILVDIGAAEGFFGIRHIGKCKKVYFFECDKKWIKYLKKTCAAFPEKAEIVCGYVGDAEGEIKLDEFFRQREKPTVVKMDVEGAEGAVLRGMSGLLRGSNPLTLFLCTYHREEDWNRYVDILKDNFEIRSSSGYYWDMSDPYPPFFRRGIMRAVKKV